jgi:hypothetical protein
MATNDFKPGLDVSTLTTLAKADLIQMVSGMTPVGDGSAAGVGMVIVMSSGASDILNPLYFPNSDGANPRYARYIWLDTYFNPPVIRVWKGDYSGTGVPTHAGVDWVPVGQADDSITEAMLKSLAVSFSKIAAPDASSANQIVTVDSNSISVTTRTLNSLLADSGITLPLDRLDKTNAFNDNVIAYNGSTWVPSSVSEILNKSLAGNSIPVGSLTYADQVGQILRANSSLVADWVVYDPANEINGGTNKVNLNMLAASGAADGSYMRYNGTAWLPFTPAFHLDPDKYKVLADTPWTASVKWVSVAHGLGSVIPTYVKIVWVNTSGAASMGYNDKDQIDIEGTCQYNVALTTRYPFTIIRDNTYVTILADTVHATNAFGAIRRDTFVFSNAFPIADWKLRIYAAA